MGFIILCFEKWLVFLVRYQEERFSEVMKIVRDGLACRSVSRTPLDIFRRQKWKKFGIRIETVRHQLFEHMFGLDLVPFQNVLVKNRPIIGLKRLSFFGGRYQF